MSELLLWLSANIVSILGIIVTIILTYFPAKWIARHIMQNIRINQSAKTLRNVSGMDVELGTGDPLHIKNLDITQNADQMENTVGLSVKANGTQSARLQGVRIVQPNAEIIISGDDGSKVEVNKQAD